MLKTLRALALEFARRVIRCKEVGTRLLLIPYLNLYPFAGFRKLDAYTIDGLERRRRLNRIKQILVLMAEVGLQAGKIQ